MKVIFTKWLPSTNTLPRRLKAYDSDGNSYVTEGMSSTQELDDVSAHIAAVSMLYWEMVWTQPSVRFQIGRIKFAEYVFVEIDENFVWSLEKP